MKLKNLFVILLALLILAPLGVVETIVWYKKKLVKREIKHKLMESLPKESLVLISVKEEEKHTKLDWEHSKEFEYNGAMFDVVYEEVNNGIINYWCWPDSDESSLNHLLKTLTKEKNQNNENDIIKLFKLLTYTISASNLTSHFDDSNTLYFGFVNIKFKSWNNIPPTPPPCQIT